MANYNHVTDALNSNTPEARRERARLYRLMVEIIASNDDNGAPGARRLAYVERMASVHMTAWCFDKEPRQVARAVIRIRVADYKKEMLA